MNNQVLRTIFERRSCRSYDAEKKVAEQDLVTVLKAGAYAPSAMNTQSWHFTAVVNKDALSRLNDAMLQSLPQEVRARIEARADGKKPSPFYNAPALIIVSLKEGVSLYPEADAACALQNMFLAATSLHLGTCWINQLRGKTPDDTPLGALLSELGVPAGNVVYGCCALGYADKESPMKDRVSGVVNIVK